MFAKEALEEIEQWRRQATSPQHQLDWRWVERYRELDSFDSYWWWAMAGPFTAQEQQQWDRLYIPNIDAATKEQLGALIAQSRQRELTAALAEQREPYLHYPALVIEEIHHRITAFLQLDAQISQEEPNALVRHFYHGAIEEEVNFLRLIEATYERNNERYWSLNLRLNPIPTQEEMDYALSHVRQTLSYGLKHPETVAASQRLIHFMQEQLYLSLDLSSVDEVHVQQEDSPSASHAKQMVTAQAAKRFFEAALQENGYTEWKVAIDPNASSPRIEQGLRQVFLPDTSLSVRQVRDYFSHEVAGHVTRCIAGGRSLLGLLGINTKNSLETEEGFALYQERQVAMLHGDEFDDSTTWLGTLATGLASGVVTPPQTFLSLFTFFELFLSLYRLQWGSDDDMQVAQKQAHKRALARCLRTFRGVPNLEQAGVCYTKDALYLRGLWLIEGAASQDETILDRLGVGVVALEQLPELQELGIISSPQPLRRLAHDPGLDAYILSFEQFKESPGKDV